MVVLLGLQADQLDPLMAQGPRWRHPRQGLRKPQVVPLLGERVLKSLCCPEPRPLKALERSPVGQPLPYNPLVPGRGLLQQLRCAPVRESQRQHLPVPEREREPRQYPLPVPERGPLQQALPVPGREPLRQHLPEAEREPQHQPLPLP